MNVEIGAEAALFPEKEYINVMAVPVRSPYFQKLYTKMTVFACSGSWPNPTESPVEEKAASSLNIHCQQRLSMSLKKLDYLIKFNYAQPGSVNDIPVVDGKIDNLFYSVYKK